MLNIISFREVQKKTTMRYHYTLLEWQKKSITLKILNAGDDAQQQEPSFIAGENTK